MIYIAPIIVEVFELWDKQYGIMINIDIGIWNKDHNVEKYIAFGSH